MPAASTAIRSPRVASSAKSCRNCRSFICAWCASRSVQAESLVSGDLVVMVVPSVAGITFVVLSEAKDLTPVPQNAIGAGARSFATLRMTGKASFYLAEIGGLQLDRGAVRRAMRRAAPGVAIARQRLGAGDAFRRNERLERV